MNRMELPERYIEKVRQLLRDEFSSHLDSFETPPMNGLRVNTGKVDVEHFLEMLPSGLNLERASWIENGFYYPQEERLPKDVYHYVGLYYLQEPSAMTPASPLPVEPGDMVLDVRVAPGGRSTELDAKLKGRGMLVANDTSNSRAKVLLENLELFGIPNICVAGEMPEKLAGVFPGFFGEILAGAPCSGGGMFRRDKDMVKSWLEKGSECYCQLQREITGQVVEMLKPGGYLLCSTCTFDREEDERTIEYLLERYPELELVGLSLLDGAVDGIRFSGYTRLLPHRIKGEGHFVAFSHKKRLDLEYEWCMAAQDDGTWRDSVRNLVGKSSSGRRLREQEPELSKFLDMVDQEFDDGRLVEKNGSVYYLPEGFPKNSRLRFLRTGFLMGELKKGRFELGQVLAMVPSPETSSRTISFGRGDKRVIRYLKRETISLTESEGPLKGWCLVYVDGFALGFVKGIGIVLRNKHYPGWWWQ